MAPSINNNPWIIFKHLYKANNVVWVHPLVWFIAKPNFSVCVNVDRIRHKNLAIIFIVVTITTFHPAGKMW
jgi:hypothetical protein